MSVFKCPKCSQPLPAEQARAGSPLVCPKCGQKLRLKAKSATPPAPRALATAEVRPPAPAKPTGPPPRFDVQPFEADGGFSGPGLGIILGGMLLAGVLLGFVASFLGQWFYLIFIFPFVIGAGVGACGMVANLWGKLRNPVLGGLLGFVAGFEAMLCLHWFDYQRFHKEAEQARPGIAAQLTFVDYMDIQATAGVTLSRFGRGNGTNLGYYGSFIYWGLEVLLVAGIACAALWYGARQPFCTACDAWKDEQKLGTLKGPPEEVREALANGELTRLGDFSPGAKDGELRLSMSVCPRCGDKGSVETELKHEAKNAKGEKSSTVVGEPISYPGEALKVFRALFEEPAVAQLDEG